MFPAPDVLRKYFPELAPDDEEEDEDDEWFPPEGGALQR